ncbi:MAG: carbohydrate binding domain-containing protein [Kiritimatiellae bacterium]|nr:carbohydrate binding domain-containing protein [Kiritimatiellia bacterium]
MTGRLMPAAAAVTTLALLAACCRCDASEFDAAGPSFKSGDKILTVGRRDATLSTDGHRWCTGQHYLATEAGSFLTVRGYKIKLSEFKADEQTKGVRHRGRFPLTKDAQGPAGRYAQTATLLPDGNVRVNVEISFDREQDRALYKSGAFMFCFPGSDLEGEFVKIDDKTIQIGKREKSGSRYLFSGGAARIEFFPNDPAKRFAFRTVRGKTWLYDSRRPGEGGDIEFRVLPVNGESEFIVELPEYRDPNPVGKVHAGINFEKRDGLWVPDYSLCRNLIQNPSFEAGLRYYAEDPCAIDNEVAYRGRRSARLDIEPGYCPMLSHFSVPTEPGKPYTFSFYAKASENGIGTSILSVSALWQTWPVSKRIKLTKDWQRYSFSFTAPNRLIAFRLGEFWGVGPDEQVKGSRIWYDCLQLEPGELTGYTEKPICAELVTAKDAHVYESTESKAMTLVLHNGTAVPVDVNVGLTVRDFFGHQRFQDRFTVRVPAGGSATHPLSLDSAVGTGLFIVRADLAAGRFQNTDLFRFSVIRSLSNRHKNKNLFAAVTGAGDVREWEGSLVRWKRAGIGSLRVEASRFVRTESGTVRANSIKGPPIRTKEHYDLAMQHNFRLMSSIFWKGKESGRFRLEKNQEVFKPENRAYVEEQAFKMAGYTPWWKTWRLINEPSSIPDPDQVPGLTMDDVAATMAAAARGLRRVIPDAVILTPEPCDMYARGRGWIERYIRAGGLKASDIVAIHPYRPKPEDPDLDADQRHFVEMLDSLGYAGPIWWMEGIYHAPLTIPEIGITAYKGCTADPYRFPAFSYDLSRSEKIAAAYTARSFIIGLKYAPRLDSNLDWSSRFYHLDADNTWRAYLFAYNTPGNILGNARFRQDVELADNVRTYLFEDEQRRPVAVLWNHDAKVDRFETDPPTAQFAFARAEVTAFDFMMNEMPDGKGSRLALPIGSFPTFVMGRPGSFAEFAAALERTTIEGAGLKRLQITSKVTGPRLTVSVNSLLSRGLAGTCRVSLNGTTAAEQPVSIAGKGHAELVTDLSAYLAGTQIRDVPLSVTFTDPAGMRETCDGAFRISACPKRKAPIRIDGNLADWAAIPGIPLGKDAITLIPKSPTVADSTTPWRGPADLSGVLRTAWDETGFYFALDLTDDVFDLKVAGHRKSLDWWQRDSIQVYFDTWADARTRESRGFDNNDYCYDFALTDDGPQANRSALPEQQIAFLEPGKPQNVQTAIRRNGTRTIYELFIPKRELVPIEFKPGTSFGFAMIAHDKDNDYRKQGLTLTPAGTEPYLNPHLYPLWVLSQ